MHRGDKSLGIYEKVGKILISSMFWMKWCIGQDVNFSVNFWMIWTFQYSILNIFGYVNASHQLFSSNNFSKIHFVLYLNEFLFSSIEYVICIFTLFILSIMYTKKVCVYIMTMTVVRFGSNVYITRTLHIFESTHIGTYLLFSIMLKDFPLKL